MSLSNGCDHSISQCSTRHHLYSQGIQTLTSLVAVYFILFYFLYFSVYQTQLQLRIVCLSVRLSVCPSVCLIFSSVLPPLSSHLSPHSCTPSSQHLSPPLFLLTLSRPLGAHGLLCGTGLPLKPSRCPRRCLGTTDTVSQGCCCYCYCCCFYCFCFYFLLLLLWLP